MSTNRHSLIFLSICIILASALFMTWPLSVYGAVSSNIGSVRVSGTQMYAYAYEMLNEVNARRKAAKLKPLVMDKVMLSSAMRRAVEVQINYQHTRPNGLKCSTVIPKSPKRLYAGENIQILSRTQSAFSNPKLANDSYYKSSGHRKNMLNPKAKSIGIGVFVQPNGRLTTCQLYSYSSAAKQTRPADKKATYIINVKNTARLVVGTPKKYLGFNDRLSMKIPVYITMPGTADPSRPAQVDASSVNFKLSNTKIASISKAGTATNKNGSSGYATLTASVKNNSRIKGSNRIYRYTLETPIQYGLQKSSTSFKTALYFYADQLKAMYPGSGYQVVTSTSSDFSTGVSRTKQSVRSIEKQGIYYYSKNYKKGQTVYMKTRQYFEKGGLTWYSTYSPSLKVRL